MSEKDQVARAQLSADDPSGTGTTIVGGQPTRPRRPLRAIPVGIEKLLYAAAIEPDFREALLRDREAAIRARGIALAPSELAMLKLAPASQLANAIDALDTSASNLARRGFLRAVAGAVTLAAGTALAGCGEKPVPQAGIMVDRSSYPDAGIPARDIPDYTFQGRDAAGMTDRPWVEAGPDGASDGGPAKDAGPPDLKKTEK
jgi:hypothetical protein